MKSFAHMLGVAMMLCCCACSGVRVLNTDKADGFQIGRYKTFEFYAVEVDGDTVSTTFQKNVGLMKAAVRRQLEARGLKISNEHPDLLVNIGVMVENKIQTRSTSIQEAPRYMGQRKYSWKSEEVEVGRYREGTGTVHLVDAASNKLVWKGAVAGVVPDNPEKVGPMIEEGIAALFAKL